MYVKSSPGLLSAATVTGSLVTVGVTVSTLLMEAEELEVLLEAENEEHDSMLSGPLMRCWCLVLLLVAANPVGVVTVIDGLVAGLVLITGWRLR